MSVVHIPDSTKELLDIYKDLIKADYVTQKMFLDSAIKWKLRSMGVKTPKDDIIDHLKKLEKSRQSHLDKQSIHHTIKRHERRMINAQKKLQDLE